MALTRPAMQDEQCYLSSSGGIPLAFTSAGPELASWSPGTLTVPRVEVRPFRFLLATIPSCLVRLVPRRAADTLMIRGPHQGSRTTQQARKLPTIRRWAFTRYALLGRDHTPG